MKWGRKGEETLQQRTAKKVNPKTKATTANNSLESGQ